MPTDVNDPRLWPDYQHATDHATPPAPMTPPLVPIPTRYKGYHFRSRLEARWAVFFDALGVRYDYEPQGFALPSGPYLPDFFLPNINGGCWVEIKGAEPTQAEANAASELATASGRPVYIFFGSIEENASGANESAHVLDYGWDAPHRWCECPRCHALGIQFEGASNRNCECVPEAEHGDRGHNLTAPLAVDHVALAYATAQCARFEHGETPRAPTPSLRAAYDAAVAQDGAA